jgi:hypothetical protein
MDKSDRKEQERIHSVLHARVSDYVEATGNLPHMTTISKLVDWSYQQTLGPEKKMEPDKKS